MVALVEQIQTDEGFRRHAYRDHLGVLTIGYGRNIDGEHGGPGISEIEAGVLLTNDLVLAETDLQTVFPGWDAFDQVRKAALLNMRFQLGPSRFRTFERMIRAINRGQWIVAAREATRSRWAVQTEARAYRVAMEIRDGVALS